MILIDLASVITRIMLLTLEEIRLANTVCFYVNIFLENESFKYIYIYIYIYIFLIFQKYIFFEIQSYFLIFDNNRKNKLKTVFKCLVCSKNY